MTSRNIEMADEHRKVTFKKMESKDPGELTLHIKAHSRDLQGDYIGQLCDTVEYGERFVTDRFGSVFLLRVISRFNEGEAKVLEEFIEIEAGVDKITVVGDSEGYADVTMALHCVPDPEVLAWLHLQVGSKLRIRLVDAQLDIEGGEFEILLEDERGRVHTREVADFGDAETESDISGYVKLPAQAADALFEMAGA